MPASKELRRDRASRRGRRRSNRPSTSRRARQSPVAARRQRGAGPERASFSDEAFLPSEERARLERDLKRHEGFRSRPYRDHLGYLTIGYGTLLENGISEELAAVMLRHDLEIHARDLVKALKRRGHRPLTEHPHRARRALLNMAYNLGIPRLMRFRRMWAALDRHDYPEAAKEALDSKWARDVGPNRSGSLARLIRRSAADHTETA